MPINPAVTTASPILSLDPHPAFTTDATERAKIHLGCDSTQPGPTLSYRVDLETLRDILAVGDVVGALDITATAHGITMGAPAIPVPVYASGGSILAANTSTAATLPYAYVVGAPDVNTLTVMTSGPLEVTAHGLTVGSMYYLQDAGSLSVTPDSNFDVPVVYAINVDVLMLQQIRAAPEPHVRFVDSLDEAVIIGATYRLRAEETVGAVTHSPGLYFLDEGNQPLLIQPLPEAA